MPAHRALQVVLLCTVVACLVLAVIGLFGLPTASEPGTKAKDDKEKTVAEQQFKYGFCYDPMTWLEESTSVQAAQVRTLLLKKPKDGDEAILQAEIDRLLSDPRADGSLGDENTTGKLIRLSRLGCSPDRPEVQAAVEYVCRDEERSVDGLLCGYALYVTEWAGYHDTELIARSTRQLASQVMTMDFWSLCPWGGQVHTRGMWSGRAHADISPALERGMNVMLSGIQEGKGWPGFLDPFGFLDAAGVIDHPLSRQIVIKQIPLILRTQQADGTWGGMKHLGYGPDDATYIVLRALIKWGLLDELRQKPPLPPDWNIVRSVPAPEGDVSMLTTGGGRLWVYDKAGGEAIGLSPEDGAEVTRVKLPSDVRNIRWQDGELAVIRVKKFVEDDWDIEELVLVDPDGDKPAREAPMSEWRGGGWHVYDFEGGPPVLEKSGPDADWGEAPFGKHTAGVTTDGEDLWVLDSGRDRICLIEKTESGKELTAAPAADPTRLGMTVPQPREVYDIPWLDDAPLAEAPLEEQGFPVRFLRPLNPRRREPRSAARFHVAWNDAGLLIACRVLDDKFLSTEDEEALWAVGGDCLVFYVVRDGQHVARFVIDPGVTDKQPEARVLRTARQTGRAKDAPAYVRVSQGADATPDDVQVVSSKLEGGYLARVRLPWPLLGIEPAEGAELGLQLIAVDVDASGERPGFSALLWYPATGTSQHPDRAHHIRLGRQAGPNPIAVLETTYGPGWMPLGIAVTARGDLAGQTVSVLDKERTLAEATLMADACSDCAIGSIPLPLPAPRSRLAQPRVMLDGRCIGRLHPEWPISDQEAPIALVRDGDSAMLTGMEAMDWGGTFFGRQDSFIAVFREVLRADGRDVSFAEVMGLSGAAFDLDVGRPWCPSTAVTEGEAFEHALKVFGYTLDQIELDGGKNVEGVARLRQAVVQRVDAGLPVIYMDGEFSLIVGYRDGGGAFICKPYAGGPPAYSEMEFPRGLLGNAWSAQAPRKIGEPMERREAIVASLRWAITFAEKPVPDKGAVSGFAGYESWIDGLRNPPEKVNLHANAYCYAILLTSRAAAADYLRIIADEVDAEAAGHLRLAADRYESVSKRMSDGRDCVEHPWDEHWTPENRAIEADIMAANLADERVAIDEIKAALAGME